MRTATAARFLVRWGLAAVCAAGLGGLSPAGGDVVCYEREVTVEAQTGCVNVTLLPQRPDTAALEKLRAEHQAELERQKTALAQAYDRRCGKLIQQVGETWERQARSGQETAELVADSKWSGKVQECQAAMRQVTEERDQLQSETAVRSGREAFATFPLGRASDRLAGFGLLAAFGGFLLGLPGRSRWLTRFLSGLVAALLALAVYLGLVATLPNTGRAHLLLAMTAALLLISLRTLLRAFLLLRQQGQGARQP